VTLAESLRPWRMAGISHFLADPDSPFLLSARETAGDRPSPASVPGRSSAFTPGRSSIAGRKPFGAAAQPAPAASLTVAPPFPASGPQQREKSSESDRPAPLIPWPPLWQFVLDRTRPAPLVWTYAELGTDLTSQGSRERSELLRSLINQLQLPKGSSAFWPVWLPSGTSDVDLSVPSEGRSATASVGNAEPDASPLDLFPLNGSHRFFQQGLRFLQARLVIFFGQRAFDLAALSAPLSMPFTQRIHGGILFVLLPDFAQLFASASQVDATRVFLRGALSFVPGLVSD
jgi:hypothetical protein